MISQHIMLKCQQYITRSSAIQQLKQGKLVRATDTGTQNNQKRSSSHAPGDSESLMLNR